MNGKGDTPRPKQVSQRVWEENWDRIFNTNTYEEWVALQEKEIKNDSRNKRAS